MQYIKKHLVNYCFNNDCIKINFDDCYLEDFYSFISDIIIMERIEPIGYKHGNKEMFDETSIELNSIMGICKNGSFFKLYAYEDYSITLANCQ